MGPFLLADANQASIHLHQHNLCFLDESTLDFVGLTFCCFEDHAKARQRSLLPFLQIISVAEAASSRLETPLLGAPVLSFTFSNGRPSFLLKSTSARCGAKERG